MSDPSPAQPQPAATMIKYEATITQIGPLTGEFIDAGILVLFGPGAPEELIEFAILHDGVTLHAPLAPGDTLWLGEAAFRILAVGEVANNNLGALGHLVLKFNGLTAPELPGDVCVEARPLPALAPGLKLRLTD